MTAWTWPDLETLTVQGLTFNFFFFFHRSSLPLTTMKPRKALKFNSFPFNTLLIVSNHASCKYAGSSFNFLFLFLLWEFKKHEAWHNRVILLNPILAGSLLCVGKSHYCLSLRKIKKEKKNPLTLLRIDVPIFVFSRVKLVKAQSR